MTYVSEQPNLNLGRGVLGHHQDLKFGVENEWSEVGIWVWEDLRHLG